MARPDRPHRDPGRKPTVTVGGRPVVTGDDEIVTTAGVGRMVGAAPPRDRSVEERTEPMPTPTKPLSTAPPA
jgi:hypothetical protein